jgi:hypothetical protein
MDCPSNAMTAEIAQHSKAAALGFRSTTRPISYTRLPALADRSA